MADTCPLRALRCPISLPPAWPTATFVSTTFLHVSSFFASTTIHWPTDGRWKCFWDLNCQGLFAQPYILTFYTQSCVKARPIYVSSPCPCPGPRNRGVFQGFNEHCDHSTRNTGSFHRARLISVHRILVYRVVDSFHAGATLLSSERQQRNAISRMKSGLL